MIKLRSKRFSRRSSKVGGSNNATPGGSKKGCGEIKWELRPGGMLVQKRGCGDEAVDPEEERMITVRVSSTVSNWHSISIEATSTFGELKTILSLVTGLEPREQRLLYKGKEREDGEHLHMAGVRDQDKLLMLEDPAAKEVKLLGGEAIGSATRHTISV